MLSRFGQSQCLLVLQMLTNLGCSAGYFSLQRDRQFELAVNEWFNSFLAQGKSTALDSDAIARAMCGSSYAMKHSTRFSFCTCLRLKLTSQTLTDGSNLIH